jgi:large-conductance mechanosensitive channel
MLDTRDIIIITAAIYLGNVVSRFFASLTDGIIMPLLGGGGNGLKDKVVVVGGVTLKTGEVLASTFQLVISFLIVVYTIGVLRTYFLSRIGAGGAK